MPGIRLFLAAVLASATASPTFIDHIDRHDVGFSRQQLKDIPLNSLNNALLNTLSPKYRDGVFEHPIEALDAVHGSDPILASKVVEVARQEESTRKLSNDLRRRQTDNTTTTATSLESPTTDPTTAVMSTPPSTVPSTSSIVSSSSVQGQSSFTSIESLSGSTSIQTLSLSATESSDSIEESSPPISNTATGILIPIEITTTDPAGNTQVQTNSIFQSSASVSIEQPFTSTNGQGQVTTATSTVPAAVFTQTNSEGRPVTTTSPVATVRVAGGSIVETGRIVTSTRQGGSVVVVTYTPVVTISQVVYRTTRLPNGQQSTITAFEVVGVDPTVSTTGSAGQTGPTPKLASGGATASTHFCSAVAAVIVGTVLGTVLML